MITPPSSFKAIEAALSQNPHLTSLPLPKADILAPDTLAQTSGTADVLRIPEVRNVINGDFIVLPCDIVCELAGESLLEAWMTMQRPSSSVSDRSSHQLNQDGLHGDTTSRKGALGVFFETKGEGSTKGEETDFIITATQIESQPPYPEGSLASHIHELAFSTTKDTLKDIVEESEFLPLRQSIGQKYPKMKILTTYRDAHIYIFPQWTLAMAEKNSTIESISEDLLGFWAKATWQRGLCEKLGLREVLHPEMNSQVDEQGKLDKGSTDLEGLSSTRVSPRSIGNSFEVGAETSKSSFDQLTIPPFLAYVHSRDLRAPLIRRVDTAALLLYVSLRLAKLEAIDDVGQQAASPLAHSSKIAYPAGVAQKTTINKADCLVADNVTVESKSIIKESVVGANCHIKSGAKLTRCVLMDGVVIGERCELTGCIIGRRAHVGSHSILVDCEVQGGNIVPDETDAKGEKFMVFEGLDATDDSGSEDLNLMGPDATEQ